MLPDAMLPVPASLASLLAVFGPLFTAPSFRTFCGMACGFLAQTGRRTVCGMLAGAGLSRAWPHDRAHWFFSRARWSADDLGLAAALALNRGISRFRTLFRVGYYLPVVTSIVAIAVVWRFVLNPDQGLVNAVNARDLPTIQLIVLILAAFYVLVNIVADVVVILVTPKLRTSSWRRS